MRVPLTESTSSHAGNGLTALFHKSLRRLFQCLLFFLHLFVLFFFVLDFPAFFFGDQLFIVFRNKDKTNKTGKGEQQTCQKMNNMKREH